VRNWIQRVFTAAPRNVARRIGIRAVAHDAADSPIAADDPRLSSALRETAIQYLSMTQKYAFDCPSLQPSAFRSALRKIMDTYGTEISAGEARTLQNKSGRLITSQWRRETEFLENKETELKSIIAMITDEFSRADSDNESFNRELTDSVTQLRDAVEVDDIKQVRARIGEVVSHLAVKIDHQRQRDVERIAELREHVEILESRLNLSGGISKTDILTGLFNRCAFDAHLAAETHLCQRQCDPLTLVLCDINQFTLTNDTYGEKLGDDCLVDVSNRLIKAFFHKTDFLARFDGDCFAVLLSQTGYLAAVKAAESLRLDVAQSPLASSAGEIQLSVSLSVVEYLPDETAAEFIKRGTTELLLAQQADGPEKDDDLAPPATDAA
jgi:diguanylate cyclase (GGDEF)-like protein